MDTPEDLPFFHKLTFKFLVFTAVFILAIEAILMVISVVGMHQRLMEIQQYIIHSLPQIDFEAGKTLLSRKQIQHLLSEYTQNIALMILVILAVVLGGIYAVVHHWFINPIKQVLKANEKTRQGQIELVPDEDIPDDEIGILIRSRNKMLDSLNTIYNDEALETLCQAVDAKDRYTVGHSRRVGMLGKLIGKQIDYNEKHCNRLHYAGTLHDIGKIGVPDHILKKEGRLTDEEFHEIQKHPSQGAQMIQFSSTPQEVIHGIEYHHEQVDGSGYPEGLKGTKIPIFGRILGVADAIDAMLSTRSYREARSIESTIEELEKYRGKQFDPDLARVGIDLLKESLDRNEDFLETYLPSKLN